jgi:hypothetical protein
LQRAAGALEEVSRHMRTAQERASAGPPPEHAKPARAEAPRGKHAHTHSEQSEGDFRIGAEHGAAVRGPVAPDRPPRLPCRRCSSTWLAALLNAAARTLPSTL